MSPIVPLGPEHQDQFARFSCAGDKPQEMVREYLAAALESTWRPVWALGIFDQSSLCALIAWREKPGDPETWEIPILATAHGYTRRGHGERLKRAVLSRAHAADPPVLAVTSEVRADNHAMLALNQKLDATVWRKDRGRSPQVEAHAGWRGRSVGLGWRPPQRPHVPSVLRVVLRVL